MNANLHYLAVLRVQRERSKPSRLHCWETFSIPGKGKSCHCVPSHQRNKKKKKCSWSFTITGWHALFCAACAHHRRYSGQDRLLIKRFAICESLLHALWEMWLSNLFTGTQAWTQRHNYMHLNINKKEAYSKMTSSYSVHYIIVSVSTKHAVKSLLSLRFCEQPERTM